MTVVASVWLSMALLNSPSCSRKLTSLKPPLPGCAHAQFYEFLAIVMECAELAAAAEVASLDDALTWALLAAGADEEDIPQSMSTRSGIGRLTTMLAEIADAAHDGG